MAGPLTLADFEDLVPPGIADRSRWLHDLVQQLNAGVRVDKGIGAVEPTRITADVNAARVALLGWAQKQPATDPRIVALRRDFLHWLLRPALRITQGPDGLVPDGPAPPVWGAQTDAIRRNVRTYGPSIARVDAEVGGVRQHFGTAWVVGASDADWVLLTAGHVVQGIQAYGVPPGTARMVLDFGCLAGPSAAALPATAPVVHQDLDIATIRLARSAAPDLVPLPLDTVVPQPLDGHLALVIGHPGFASPAERIFATDTVGFDGVTGVKRAAPGCLRAATGGIPLVSGQPRWRTAFAHDATTLGGNSGSPVLSLATERVVGLHVGGRPTNGSVPSWFLDNYALSTHLLRADALLQALTERGVTVGPPRQRT